MDTFEKICSLIKINPSSMNYYENGLMFAKSTLKRDILQGMIQTKRLKKLSYQAIKNELVLKDTKLQIAKFIHKCLIAESPYSLDSYFQALEYYRPLKEQFWLPRRKQLLPIVRELEKLIIYDQLDELFMSMPPRTGKTTLVEYTYTWIIGYKHEYSNLYVSFSGGVANSFFEGVKEIINDKFTYRWQEIFSDVAYDDRKMSNSKETYLDTGRKKRYHSLTCRSIDGTLNGSCDCRGLLVGDDLISGIEEALSESRLTAVWQKTDNDMLSRAKEHAKILWIGTRWSKKDPIGRRIETLTEQPEFAKRRVKIINIPALNDNDESNFDYLYGVGFSTEYFKQRRASFENAGDLASYLAMYQGQPIERSNLLFPADDLLYFDELPQDLQLHRIIAPVDVAWGGGDALSSPCMYVYKNPTNKKTYEIYVPQVIYDFGDKTKTQPKLCNMIVEHNISWVQFEQNGKGDEYKEQIDEMLKSKNIKCELTTKPAPIGMGKVGRIYQNAPDIKLHWHFLTPAKRNKDYKMFMQNLLTYSETSKHDDAPDSCVQGNNMLYIKMGAVSFYELMRRPF